MVDVVWGLTAILSIFAIVDPIAVVPFFASFTEGYTPEQKRRVIQRSTLVALLTLLVFALIGQYIFLAFGFTIPAFQIAGGIVLFAVGFEMLHGRRSRMKLTEAERLDAFERDIVGVVPLGIPLLAGPGAITTVMIYMSADTGNPFDKTFVFLGIAIAIAASYLTLHAADPIFRRVGRTGVHAVSRVIGLLLAAIGIQFVINGIVGAARLNGLM